MISKEIDLGKARTMLYYLSKSKKKIDERELARKKLEIKLRQLKKISTKSIQKHLEELEGHIAETISKERQIVKAGLEEEGAHKAIADKIDLLEKKLGKYLETKEARQKRIKELEEKIKGQTESKRENVKEVAEQVKALEKLYKQAKKSKKVPKAKLNRLQKRINILKEKLKLIKK